MVSGVLAIKVSEVGIDPKVTALVRIVIDPRIPGCSCDLPVLACDPICGDFRLGPVSPTDRFQAGSSEENHEKRRDQE